jgi:predicted metal-dependent phosphoesterase TrpH
MLKVDLHLHTAEDPHDYIVHDAITLIDRAAELGYRALAITLHDRQLWERRIIDYARERGIVLLSGVERTLAGRHILLVNFPAAAEQARTFDEISNLKGRCNGLVIAPHPFFPSPSCLGRTIDHYVDLFDAVEWSYFWTSALDFNSRAARWARRHGKALVGNSDLHDLRQLGRTYSTVDAEPDADAICDAIRHGRVSITTSPVPIAELARTLGGMAWRDLRLKVAPPSPVRAPSRSF